MISDELKVRKKGFVPPVNEPFALHLFIFHLFSLLSAVKSMRNLFFFFCSISSQMMERSRGQIHFARRPLPLLIALHDYLSFC